MMGWMAPLRHLSAKLLSDRISSEWEPSLGEVTTIGLDLTKHVFRGARSSCAFGYADKTGASQLGDRSLLCPHNVRSGRVLRVRNCSKQLWNSLHPVKGEPKGADPVRSRALPPEIQ